MKNELLVICFIAHILGEFYLNNPELVKQQSISLKNTLLKSLKYCIPYLILWLIAVQTINLWLIFLIICSIHITIKILKYLYNRRKRAGNSYELKEQYAFIIIQGLYISSIVITCFLFQTTKIKPLIDPRDFLDFLDVDSLKFLKWLLATLIIAKPINISFSTLFSVYRPKYFESNVDEGINKAGAIIGLLERIIILIFLSLRQYSAVGLVLTAKSIARYDKITKSQEFAEYYLIGTLVSLISALLVFCLIF